MTPPVHGSGLAYSLGVAAGLGLGLLIFSQVTTPEQSGAFWRPAASIAGAAVAVASGSVYAVRFRRPPEAAPGAAPDRRGM